MGFDEALVANGRFWRRSSGTPIEIDSILGNAAHRDRNNVISRKRCFGYYGR